jgi:SCP-2 sterol transfer family
MSSDAIPLLEQAVTRFLEEVPALRPMKLVIKVELQGRGDTQQFRVELPGPKVTKDVAADSKVTVHMQRAFFNEMAKDAKVADWREAFMYGQAKASGPTQILQLVERVVEKQEERARTRRARH